MRLTGKLTNEVQNHTLKIWQIQCVCVCVRIYYTVKMGGNCKPLSNTFMSSFYQHLTPFLMHFVLRLVLHVDKVLPKRVNLIKAHTTLNPGPMKLSCIHIIGTFSISGSANPDDVIKWKHFPCNLTLVWRIHRSPVNSPHKGQWHGSLMFSLICLKQQLSKQWRRRWFETPSRSLWRHCNELPRSTTDRKLARVCTRPYAHSCRFVSNHVMIKHHFTLEGRRSVVIIMLLLICPFY